MHVLPFQIEEQLTSQAAAASTTASSVDECPICLMEIDMVSDPLAVLKPCGHIFQSVIFLSLLCLPLLFFNFLIARLSIITFNIQNFKFPAKFPGFLKIWDT